MDKGLKISIIFVNYHTSNLIIECINSILRHCPESNYEIIVVDNNSETDIADKLVAQFPAAINIRAISLPENIGFGRANNAGAKISSGDYLFFLNPDTILLNNAPKILSDFLDSTPKAGICGANLYTAQKAPNFSHYMFLPGVKWELNNTLHNLIANILYGKNFMHNHTQAPIRVGYVSGADLMIRRNLFEQLGGFDSSFFMYFEETDLCFRAKIAGYNIYNIPQAKIIHLEGSAVKTVSKPTDFKIEQLERSRSIFYHKNCHTISRRISYMLYNVFLRSRCALCRNSDKREIMNTHLVFMKKYRHQKSSF